jgi:hypothetical protein
MEDIVKNDNEISNIRVDYHRNGISGEGFHVALFDNKLEGESEPRHFVGVLFEGGGRCAVFDVDELKAGNIQFAQGNSWRGDYYEGPLREAIAKAETGKVGPFALPLKKRDLSVK